jgi:hypothetical protein
MLLNALPAWSTNPYSSYSGEHLLHALARTRIRDRPGSRVRYSNYGAGILGRLLADTGAWATRSFSISGCARPSDCQGHDASRTR